MIINKETSQTFLIGFISLLFLGVVSLAKDFNQLGVTLSSNMEHFLKK